MRKLLIAAVLALSVPAHAADKNGPPATLDQILALESLKRPMTCNVELSAAGTFLKAGPREASGGFGGGCDVIAANLLIGAGLRADFADWRNSGSLFAKIGLVLNSGAHLYGLAEWKVPEWKVKDAGQLHLGAGGELKLEIVNPNLWIFTEGTIAATKFGPLATKDDIVVRTGARYRF